jgi:hypothetical protein
MDDIIDEFFNDYENEQNNPNLKVFLNFISNLEYEGKDINPDTYEIKFKKRLKGSKWIPPSDNSLF